ncbi:methionine aminopeptidase [Anaerobacillus alkaliphilus]|uniref:Methionine aminopeptidase n=1 Tax=Anaerobacillus alkaliphilus TaxID=1548597 RepID=A0A4Q0VX31_9BACI|nr:methionine aminopeptidase [Anaerobacillus alkaliphilus]RXJ04214.1 methionine aminopeptidase [Anaerobacillus alkaliphilus]
MKLLDHFFDWHKANYDKKVEKMKEQGICPDCRGKGYHATVANAYIYMPSFDYKCYNCNGTGSYSEWENPSL